MLLLYKATVSTLEIVPSVTSKDYSLMLCYTEGKPFSWLDVNFY